MRPQKRVNSRCFAVPLPRPAALRTSRESSLAGNFSTDALPPNADVYTRFQPAASSPSSRSVKHLALPPALTNSSSGVSRSAKPRSRSEACNRGQPVLVTTVRPTTTALQAKRRASSFVDGNQLVDRWRQAPAAVIVEGRRDNKSPGPARADKNTCRGDSNKDRPAPAESRGSRTSRRSADGRGRRCECDSRRTACRRRTARRRPLRRTRPRADGGRVKPCAASQASSYGFLALPLRITKPGQHRLVAINQRRVGREHQVGQARAPARAIACARRALQQRRADRAIAARPARASACRWRLIQGLISYSMP